MLCNQSIASMVFGVNPLFLLDAPEFYFYSKKVKIQIQNQNIWKSVIKTIIFYLRMLQLLKKIITLRWEKKQIHKSFDFVFLWMKKKLLEKEVL